MTKRKRVRGRNPTKVVNSGYSEGGASHTRSALRGWNPLKSSPAADVDVSLATLRSRSADLYTNSPLGSAALNCIRTNVVGAGLKPFPKVDHRLLGITPEAAKEWQRNALREFSLWADGVGCDIYRKNNFYDMQDVLFISCLVDGDGWAIKKYRKATGDNPYSLRIQLVESARICNPNTYGQLGESYATVETAAPNGNRIINGIELDNDSAVVAYWVANMVPVDLAASGMRQLEWNRLEAFGKKSFKPNVLQISHEERPEQYRGVPTMAPAIEMFKQVQRYTNAELTAAIIKSFFTLFFVSQESNSGSLDDALQSAVTPRERVAPEDLDGIEVGPGTLNLLPEGIDVKAIDGSRTLSTFEAFCNNLFGQIGGSMGLPSEVMLSRFQSSYSAARAALLQAQAMFKTRRTWFVRDFCQPIYEAWLDEAVAIGRLKAPGYGSDPLVTRAWRGAEWYGPVMGQLDPTKEAKAALMRCAMGASTFEREAAEITGTNFDDNVDRLQQEATEWGNAGFTSLMQEGGNKNEEQVLENQKSEE